ncbi:hypothetical protein [Lederbergia lenta]|uniref:hypothetical protein n=1 Tax=Lederbergia lenta TaxID=1467 RepID=UPI0020410F0B|nr:hypothetical protein [Lederbergia lenta]MCM3113403.1 hypothetical protein [Lederbergia lenta]
MKKITIIAATLLLLTIVGVSYAAQAKQDTKSLSENATEIHKQKSEGEDGEVHDFHSYDTTDEIAVEMDKNETSKNISVENKTDKLPEYSIISTHVDMEHLNAKVVEDNHNKRVILIIDDNGQSKFKSIYVKNTNRLKLIDFEGGLVFDQNLERIKESVEATTDPAENESVKNEAAEQKRKTETFPEYSTISSHVDMKDLNEQVAEDNHNKRVILFKDDNDQQKFKSIYVKNTKRLKIINFDGDAIYNAIIL